MVRSFYAKRFSFACKLVTDITADAGRQSAFESLAAAAAAAAATLCSQVVKKSIDGQ
jgi:hypothetical protein